MAKDLILKFSNGDSLTMRTDLIEAGGDAFTCLQRSSIRSTVYYQDNDQQTTFLGRYFPLGTYSLGDIVSWCATNNVACVLTNNSNGATPAVAQTPLIILTNSLPALDAQEPYSATIQAAGGSGTYTWTKTGSLPTGLTLNASTGVISGTPTVAGTSTFTVTATDSLGNTVTSANLSIVIYTQLTVSTSSITAGVDSVAFSQTLATAGGHGTKTWSHTGSVLPTGVTLSASGVLSGTPAAGSHTASPFTVAGSVTDQAGGTATFTYSWTITAS